MKLNRKKWFWLMAIGGTMLQLSACLGDPQYLAASYVARWLTSSIITTFFNSLTTASVLPFG